MRRWRVVLVVIAVVIGLIGVVVPPSGALPGTTYGHAIQVDAQSLAIQEDSQLLAVGLGGAVNIYEKVGPAAYQLKQQLVSVGFGGTNRFGEAVAFSGPPSALGRGQPYLAVGSPGESLGGVVHLFRWDLVQNEFAYSHKVEDPNAAADDQFGSSLAFDRNTLVVGARGDDDAGCFPWGDDAGAVHVFTPDIGSAPPFLHRQELDPVHGTCPEITRDNFGGSVAVDGNTLVAGAPGEGCPHWSHVFVYTRASAVDPFAFSQLFQAPTPGACDWFGAIVDIAGNAFAAIEANGEVHVYGRASATAPFGFEQTLTDPTPTGAAFGSSLDLVNGTVVVGAAADDGGVAGSGTVHLFEGAPGTYVHKAVLIDPAGAAADQFGALAVSEGDIVVVSAPFDDPFPNIHIFGPAGPPVLCDGKPATMVGTANDDVLIGTAGDDVIVGLGGNDTILSGRGNDVVCAGPGNDMVGAARGADTVFGEDGDDTIFGGPGADILDGGAGEDRIFGGDDVDTITGGPDDDRLAGHDGEDVIDGEGGDDELFGGNDDDTLDGGDGADDVNGNVGNDTIDGGIGNDVLKGAPGDDTINGGDGADRIGAGSGKDTINGGNGIDTIFAGPGDDVVRGDAGADVLRGGLHDDTIHGGTEDDLLVGGPGSDTLNGDAGDDVLKGCTGDDTIDGGDGTDRAHGGPGADTCAAETTSPTCEA